MQKSRIGIVIPVHNEENNLASLFQALRKVFFGLSSHYIFSILFVDDGSTDQSLSEIQVLRREDARIQWISLSRRFGKEVALTAGLDFLEADALILMDADLQHPPDLIPELLSTWRQSGADVVYAQMVARDHEGWCKRFLTRRFYGLLNRMTDIEMPPHAGDFRLLSARAVAALRSLPEQHRYMKGLYAWIGFQQVAIPFVPNARRSGSSKWSYRQLGHLALEGLTSFSTVPLRLASYLGVLVASTGFVYALWILFKTLYYGEAVKGFPTIMIVMLLLGGVQLLTLGILGEYLGRVFQESKRRPLYVCKASSLSPVFPGATLSTSGRTLPLDQITQ